MKLGGVHQSWVYHRLFHPVVWLLVTEYSMEKASWTSSASLPSSLDKGKTRNTGVSIIFYITFELSVSCGWFLIS